MFMQSRFSGRRGQHVSACAAHRQQRSNSSAAAALLGVALQVAVVSAGPADAISTSIETPAEQASQVQTALGQSASDVKNLLDRPAQVSTIDPPCQ